MSVITQTIPIMDGSAWQPGVGLAIEVAHEGHDFIVQAVGEMDMASRHQLVIAAIAGNHPTVVIDLARVTFMDCRGYGALVLARLLIERDGRSLTIRGQTGQPAQLLRLIELSHPLELDHLDNFATV